jgi:uncharacterized protein YndB with AHSA1/START domain
VDDSLQIATILPATPGAVYDAWMSSRKHSAFIGGSAAIEARVGGEHRAFDDYIRGKIVALESDRRIVMTWRTTEFPPAAPDSRLEVILEPTEKGTRLTLVHTGLPAGDAEKYDHGWRENYFEPMSRYFAVQQPKARKQPKPRRARKAPARRAARRSTTPRKATPKRKTR